MWGCTVLLSCYLLSYQVFPTHVGVYRDGESGLHSPVSIPHACGGVPVIANIKDAAEEYSPRMWGCTVSGLFLVLPLRVFPTHVGVYRNDVSNWLSEKRIPHACGGVP